MLRVGQGYTYTFEGREREIDFDTHLGGLGYSPEERGRASRENEIPIIIIPTHFAKMLSKAQSSVAGGIILSYYLNFSDLWNIYIFLTLDTILRSYFLSISSISFCNVYFCRY